MELTPTVELTAVEARVVGSLIEKAALTPDIYPMTTNALVSACNQKTNREPVVSYDAVTIDAALLELRQRNIVRRVHAPGSRATRHRHALDDVLDVDDAELALLCVLLLRGAQTVGELRLRTERQHEFASVESVERCLERLASRATPLVRQLPRRPGQKEARWQHLLGDADDPSMVPGAGDDEPTTMPVPGGAPNGAAAHTSVAASGGADADLVHRVDELEAEVAGLRSQLARLAEQLGESLD